MCYQHSVLLIHFFSGADMEVTLITCLVGLRITRLAQLVDATANANSMAHKNSTAQRFTQKLETMGPVADDNASVVHRRFHQTLGGGISVVGGVCLSACATIGMSRTLGSALTFHGSIRFTNITTLSVARGALFQIESF
jgi:hypothetical protein